MKPSLLLPEPPLQVLPSLALKIGLNEAIVLQQIHYWLNPKFNDNVFEGKHWVHNTYEEWQVQFPFWSERTVRRIIGFLEDQGLILSFITGGIKKTKFYTLNYDQLDCVTDSKTEAESQDYLAKGVGQIGGSGQIEGGQDGRQWVDSLTTTYNMDTETTSENTLLLKPLPKTADVAVGGDGEEEDEEEKNKIEKNEKEILNQLFQIWNTGIQKKLNAADVIPTSGRLSKLQSVFDGVFESNPKRWQAYCEQIASLQFLMGKNPSGFTVTLDWALNPDNARKVLEKAIYDKPVEGVVTILPEDAFTAEITKTHTARGYSESWTRICLRLAQRLGQPIYTSWISKLSPDALGGAVAEIRAENAFIRDYIQRAYGDAIMDAVRAECPQIRSIHLFCSGETPS